MIFSKDNIDDIKKYYLNSVVKFPETGDRLMQIININNDEVTCVDVDGFELHIDLSEEYEVEYPLPARTVYQQGNCAVMLVRKPAQQYYRGIHEKNTGLMALTAGGKWTTLSLNLPTLQQFVDKPCYQDPNLVSMNDPHQSYALNKYTAVTKAAGEVFILTKKVAEVLWATKTIHNWQPIFKSELQEAFPGWEFV